MMMTSLSTKVLAVTFTLIVFIIVCDVTAFLTASSQRHVTGVTRRPQANESVISDALSNSTLSNSKSIKESNLTLSVASNHDSRTTKQGLIELRAEQLEYTREKKVKQRNPKKQKPERKAKKEKHTSKNKKEVDDAQLKAPRGEEEEAQPAPFLPPPSAEHRREVIQTFKRQMLRVLGLKSKPRPRGRIHVPPHMMELYQAYTAANRRRLYERAGREREREGEAEEEEEKRMKEGGKKQKGPVAAFPGNTIRSFIAHVHGMGLYISILY